ncbi:MAG: hypothetical protein IT327_07710 [Anaerolineae bacterium]|nr:hypothetical protein [Anaerolineae bacterium]
MISLLSLTKYTDDRYAARWLDDEFGLHYEFNALHDGNGRSLCRGKYDPPAPTLTAEQLSTAQSFIEPTPPAPTQHPAYELAERGSAVRPEWANRYTKAAQLVEAGQVRLTGPETAVVTGSSDTYQVNGKCGCKWAGYHSEPCSHYLAVRMARALAQPVQPITEDEKEAAHAARVAANRDAAQLRIARRGENKFERARRNQVGTAEEARRYIRATMANGGTVPADIWQKAHGGLLAGQLAGAAFAAKAGD